MKSVNIETLELCKENIRPIPTGYSASALVLGLQKGPMAKPAGSHTIVWEEVVALSEDSDDPLQPFLDHLNNLGDSLPSNLQNWIALLEKIAFHFVDDSQYKNDVRYLSLWTKLAPYRDDPGDLFHYIGGRNIGAKLALFYVQYANFLETVGSISEAEKILRLGLERNAKPTKRLLSYYKEFLRRNDRCRSKDDTSIALPVSTKALSQTESNISRRPSMPQERRKKSLLVYTDPEQETSQFSFKKIEHLQLNRLSRQENELAPTSWAGQTIDSQCPRISGLHNRLVIFEDPPKQNVQQAAFSLKVNADSIEQCSNEQMFLNESIFKDENGSEVLLAEALGKIRVESHSRKLCEEEDFHVAFSSPVRPYSPTITIFTKDADREVLQMFSRESIEAIEETPETLTEDFTYYKELKASNPIDMCISVERAVTPENSNTLISRPDLNNERATKNKHENVSKVLSLQQTTAGIDAFKVITSDEIVNPLNEATIQQMLKAIEEKEVSIFADIKKIPEKMSKRCILKTSVNSNRSVAVQLLSEEYYFKTQLGTGGYGEVYLVESKGHSVKCIKLSDKSSLWEYIMIKLAHSRLSYASNLCENIVKADSLILFEDESYMSLEYYPQGTILDAVNRCSLDEISVMFFTAQLLKTVAALHSVGIIHGDLKPDNVIIRMQPSRDSSKRYSKHYNYGITLIDFGRSIDTTIFTRGTQFTTDLPADNQDCLERRQKKPWTFQVDYFGLAAIVHCMLFKKFITTTVDSDNNEMISTALKRYWQRNLWSQLFETLLNSKKYVKESGCENPITSKLEALHSKLESYLQKHDVEVSLRRILL